MLPINHLLETLQRCCGRFRFEHHDESRTHSPWTATVRHLKTNVVYRCRYVPQTKKWEVTAPTIQDETFLSSRLNGQERNDAGDLPSDFACVPGVE